MDKEIVIKPNYCFEDYFKVNLRFYFNQLIIKIFLLVSLSLMALTAYWIWNSQMASSDLYSTGYIVLLLFPLLCVLTVYIQTKRVLSDPKLKEDISLKLSTAGYENSGETYNIRYPWKDIFKIIEKDKWFLIYISKSQAKLIRKADLKDNQYNELKALFNSLDIKKSLK